MKSLFNIISLLSFLCVLSTGCQEETINEKPKDLDFEVVGFDAVSFNEQTVKNLYANRDIDFNSMSARRRSNDAMLTNFELRGSRLPDEVYFQGLSYTDNGRGYDLRANDGVFTLDRPATVYVGGRPVVDPNFVNISCPFAFSFPGETCQDETCPERSLLGGKTLVCFCIDGDDCEINFGF